jgi:hypothetical protein
MQRQIIFTLKVRNGEYEYERDYIRQYQDNPTDEIIEQHLEEVASTYYSQNPSYTEENRGSNFNYNYFFGGEICVWIYSWKDIPEVDYLILKKYLQIL